MFKKFLDLILGAENQAPPEITIPFDVGRYAPEFTPEDHALARREGCVTAKSRWLWMTNNKITDYANERRKLRSRAQFQLDMFSAGVPPDELANLSDEVMHLPRDPYYKASREPTVAKDPYIRDAQIAGMKNQLIDFWKRLEQSGITPEAVHEDENVLRSDTYRWHERAMLAQRLAGLGMDIEEVERGIQDGSITHQEFVEEPPEFTEEPELKRVSAAYDEELNAVRAQHGLPPLPKKDSAGKYGPNYHPSSISKAAWPREERESFPLGPDENPASPRHTRTSSPTGGPRMHLKDAETALMKERLVELQELLEELGYSRDLNWRDAAPRDREAVREIQVERAAIGRDLAGFTEDIKEIEAEMDAGRIPSESPRRYLSAEPEGDDEGEESEEESEDAEEDAGETDNDPGGAEQGDVQGWVENAGVEEGEGFDEGEGWGGEQW